MNFSIFLLIKIENLKKKNIFITTILNECLTFYSFVTFFVKTRRNINGF